MARYFHTNPRDIFISKIALNPTKSIHLYIELQKFALSRDANVFWLCDKRNPFPGPQTCLWRFTPPQNAFKSRPVKFAYFLKISQILKSLNQIYSYLCPAVFKSQSLLGQEVLVTIDQLIKLCTRKENLVWGGIRGFLHMLKRGLAILCLKTWYDIYPTHTHIHTLSKEGSTMSWLSLVWIVWFGVKGAVTGSTKAAARLLLPNIASLTVIHSVWHNANQNIWEKRKIFHSKVCMGVFYRVSVGSSTCPLLWVNNVSFVTRGHKT